MAILHKQSVTPRHLETYSNDDCHGCVAPILSSKLKAITVALLILLNAFTNDVESLSDRTGQLVISRNVARYLMQFIFLIRFFERISLIFTGISLSLSAYFV